MTRTYSRLEHFMQLSIKEYFNSINAKSKSAHENKKISFIFKTSVKFPKIHECCNEDATEWEMTNQ